LALAILLFWMATTGWFFHRDLWPRLRPNQPPPFTIDLADEARRHSIPTRWKMSRGDKLIGSVKTDVQYRDADDSFALKSEVENLALGVGPLLLRASKITSVYRVTREGQLLAISIDVQGLTILLAGIRAEADVHLEGVVDNQRFTPEGYLKMAGREAS
jgi:hypothetical protein